MLSTIFMVLTLILMSYLVLSGAYQFLLAVSSFVKKDVKSAADEKKRRFAIITPAHNEELLIDIFCQSILSVNYPSSNYKVFVIADNCNDLTAEKCKKYTDINVLERYNKDLKGKGYALDWALEQIDMSIFDAVLIIDADTTVDREILNELNNMLGSGERVIQCYIDVPNKTETSFTRLISLSRTINNLLYHYPKHKLGLSAYLMGTGMCFTKEVIENVKWNAYSLSEDWEYYSKLVKNDYRIAFGKDAIIHQQESSNLRQATTQRLRWSSGRFYVVKNVGISLLVDGILKRNIRMADASLALLFPNWSLQINLLAIAAVTVLLQQAGILKDVLAVLWCSLVLMQFLIIVIGILITRRPIIYIKAILYAPIFLIWKAFIDILTITKIYKGKEWIRTKRHVPKE